MKALVYHGANKHAWEEKPKPVITNPTDAIVRILKTTICGTDLHIMKGDVPEVIEGLTLGHEGVGVIEDVGTGVADFQIGDKVLISITTSCGRCSACKKGMISHCESGGWLLGHLIDGTQAEYVRIPYADFSLHHIPDDANEEAVLMLSDLLPTGFECGVLKAQIKPGDTVAIIGAGPVGLGALLTAKFFSPSEIIMVDSDPFRLSTAKTFGATQLISGNAVEQILQLTNGRGVDAAIEAVGIPATFDICQSIIAVGGHIANIGVHGKSVELHLEKLWSKEVTITTRLVDTITTPMLLSAVLSGRLTPGKLVTHRFPLQSALKAYDVFGNAAKEKAIKVVLTSENI